MKKDMKTLSLIAVFILSVNLSSTAYDPKCNDFLNTRLFKMSDPGNYLPYGQSKSESVEVRRLYKFEIVFIGKKEYKIGIATEEDYEPIHFRIIDNQKKVLYDNKQYQYKGSVDFYMEKTQSITIEITVLASNELLLLPRGLRTCLGIKIFNKSIV